MQKLILSLILLIAGALIAIPSMYQTWQVNAASLDYKDQIFDASAGNQIVPSVSESHPRATYLRAANALNTSDFDTVLELMVPLGESGDELALELAAIAYEGSGQYLEAIDIHARFGYIDGLLRVAETAVEAGSLDVAYQAYLKAWKLDPIVGTSPLAKFVYEEQGNPVLAEALYRQALDRYQYIKHRPYWWRALARMLGKENRWQEAAAAYQKVIDESHLMYLGDRRNPMLYGNLAWARHMNNQHQEAVAAIERSLDLAGSDPPYYILRYAGQIYEAVGDLDKAVEYYQGVLVTHPDDRISTQALERLINKP